MTVEFNAQKLFSARRKSVRPPYHPMTTSAASTTSDEMPIRGAAIRTESLLAHVTAAIGASPSRRLGSTSSSNQARTSFIPMISTSMLPASEMSVRFLRLVASSSMSPRRGSTIGIMTHAFGDQSMITSPPRRVSAPSASTASSITSHLNLPLMPAKNRTDAKMIVNIM